MYSILFSSFLFLLISSVWGLAQLNEYNIDTERITVSGFSSGGYMTVQLQVAFSSLFFGAGIISGGPYHYATTIDIPEGSESFPILTNVSLIHVERLFPIVAEYEKDGKIDSVSHLRNIKVFLLDGELDTVIYPGIVQKTFAFLKHYVKEENIFYEHLNSVHCYPTENYGSPCKVEHPDLICNCSFAAAYKILNHLLPNIVKPPKNQANASQLGTLHSFNAGEFVQGANCSADIGLDDIAYLYVPSQCENNSTQCKLHIALHGCTQGVSFLGTKFVIHTGYNDVAAVNDLIILYPQAKKIPISNPYGCWDWIASTGRDFATKQGPQMATIVKMVERLTGRTFLKS